MSTQAAPASATTVVQQPAQQTIVIEPADPEVVYVPSYNPSVVYGSWAYPSYPPYYYPPPAYYYPGGALLSFGIGVAVGGALWGDCNWGGGDIDIDVNRYNEFNSNRQIDRSNNKFTHNAANRDGVPYRDNASRERYGRQNQGAANREAYRGRDQSQARAAPTAIAPASRWSAAASRPASSNAEARQRAGKASRDMGPEQRARAQGAAGQRQAATGNRAQGAAGQRPATSNTRAQQDARQRASSGTYKASQQQQRLLWCEQSVAVACGIESWQQQLLGIAAPVGRTQQRSTRAPLGAIAWWWWRAAWRRRWPAPLNRRMTMTASIRLLAVACLAVLALPAHAQKAYPTPKAATDALVAALGTEHADRARLGRAVRRRLGTLHPLDNIDRKDTDAFLARYREYHQFKKRDATHTVLSVGKDRWTLPVPLTKGASGWAFDLKAGEAELRARRIGRNELDVVQAALAYVDAQEDYSREDRDGDGVLEYAQRFVSTDGAHDGLFWEDDGGEPSPLGPLFGDDTPDGEWHGYHYRILTAQGVSAPRGAYSYKLGENMSRGFALVMP